MKKKVLLVIPSLEQGGGQKFVMDLANGIDKEKFHVRVLVYYKKTNSIFDRFAEENGIEIVYLNKQRGFKLSFMNDVRREVRRFSPDVIHTHLQSMLYLLTSYTRGQIKLHTVHTLAQKEAVGLQKLVCFVAYKLLGVKPVAICKTVAESISNTHRIKLNKIPIVYNGVDCERYNIPKAKSEKIQLVSAGSIYEVKNFSFLVDCFAEACKNRDDLHLTIVGDGVLRPQLEKQIEDLGLSDKITLPGVVSNVEKYLAKADIYVASSVFEGFPISMLEAMSAGLPIISTNVGGVGEIVQNGVNGILVNPGDKEGYVSALNELITNTDKRAEYSATAKRLSRNYDEKITVKGYEQLYQK